MYTKLYFGKFRDGIAKKTINIFKNGNGRYIERVGGDTVGLVLYKKGTEVIVDNNPKMSERQVKTRISFFRKFVG